MLPGRLTLAALFLAVSVSGALGLAAMIGDTFVKLPPPAGFCELTPSHEFDGRTVAAVSAYMAGDSIKLLGMSADCNQLAGAREGKQQLDDVALIWLKIRTSRCRPHSRSRASARPCAL